MNSNEFSLLPIQIDTKTNPLIKRRGCVGRRWFTSSVFLPFSEVCSDSVFADVKQRITGMCCQLETLVYLTDTDTVKKEMLDLRSEGTAVAP